MSKPKAVVEMADDKFPVIDFSGLATDPDGLAAQVLAAATRWGFFALEAFDIAQADVDEIFALSEQFFAEPAVVKEEKWATLNNQGYEWKRSRIGVHEAVSFGNVAGSTLTADAFSTWWTAERRQRIESFRTACQRVADDVMGCLERAMKLAPTTLTAAHDPRNAPGNSLRMIHYDKLVAPLTDPHLTPRLCEHTDWGSMTLLFARTPGLEVRGPQNTWVDAPTGHGRVVVNVADGLALWTDGVLRSAAHRLTWDTVPWHQERYSLAYFVNANAHVPIEIMTRSPDGGFAGEKVPVGATFGDYQKVRVNMIESHDTHLPPGELEVDPKLLELVRRLGVAEGPGLEHRV